VTRSIRTPDAWRAAVKLLELRFGAAPPEREEVGLPSHADEIAATSWQQMQVLAARLVTLKPGEDTVAIAPSCPAY